MSETPGKQILRWGASLLIAFVLLLATLIAVLRSKKEYIIKPAPPIQLDFVTLKEQKKAAPKKAKKSPPKKQKKPKKKVIKKKQPQKVPEKAIAQKVEEVIEEPIEEVIDTVAKEVEEETPVKQAGVTKEALPQRISGAASLDNSDFSPLFNPKPKYPPIAKRAGIEGFVDIDLIIDPKGKVEKYTIVGVHGHNSFANETKKVIMKWRFPPPRLKGKPITVKYVYRLKFTLH